MELSAYRCTHCAAVCFPRRHFCPACGGGRWSTVDASRGEIDEITVVRHRAGAGSRQPTVLATVRTVAGPAIVARLEHAARRGDAVRLALDAAGAVVASPGARSPRATNENDDAGSPP